MTAIGRTLAHRASIAGVFRLEPFADAGEMVGQAPPYVYKEKSAQARGCLHFVLSAVATRFSHPPPRAPPLRRGGKFKLQTHPSVLTIETSPSLAGRSPQRGRAGEGVSCVVYEQMSAFSHSQPSPQPLSLAAQAILVATRAMLIPEGKGLKHCWVTRVPR